MTEEGENASVGGCGRCGMQTWEGVGETDGVGVGDGDAVRVANMPLHPKATSVDAATYPRFEETCPCTCPQPPFSTSVECEQL